VSFVSPSFLPLGDVNTALRPSMSRTFLLRTIPVFSVTHFIPESVSPPMSQARYPPLSLPVRSSHLLIATFTPLLVFSPTLSAEVNRKGVFFPYLSLVRCVRTPYLPLLTSPFSLTKSLITTQGPPALFSSVGLTCPLVRPGIPPRSKLFSCASFYSCSLLLGQAGLLCCF